MPKVQLAGVHEPHTTLCASIVLYVCAVLYVTGIQKPVRFRCSALRYSILQASGCLHIGELVVKHFRLHLHQMSLGDMKDT